jgi:hypothetical protein
VIAGLAPHHPDPATRGELHGRRFRTAVRSNVGGFLEIAGVSGWDVAALRRWALSERRRLPAALRSELSGIAAGAGIDQSVHILYEVARHRLAPDECTVAAAIGGASGSGATVLLKNSDKIGADSLTGEGFHRFKEINVVVDGRNDNGVRIVGVAAAGSIGLKMGVNDAGVVAASNIARTIEMRLRHPGVDDLRALDRGRLLREGLGHRDPASAARSIVAAVMETPMATPGTIEFADASRMVVIEGSYEHLAVETIRDRVVVRTNMFVTLAHLNDPGDTSSPARAERARHVLEPRSGSIIPADLRALSQDHVNGPGVDSICRHSADPHDETSLSAMVVATNPDDPTRTTLQIALGKPCWAWSGSGVFEMRMDDGPEAVDERFRSGSAWRDNYREDPRV